MDAEENKRIQAQFVDMICHEIRYPRHFLLFCSHSMTQSGSLIFVEIR